MQPDTSNMTPEQIQELQKQQCIFCHIVAGKVASKKIYEDEHVLAILDIHPANPGHLLLIPKKHYAIMPQMPADIVGHMGKVSKALSKMLLRSLQCQGTNILTANGVAAGQKAPHVIVHIIPRNPDDHVPFSLPEKPLDASILETSSHLIEHIAKQTTLKPVMKTQSAQHTSTQSKSPVHQQETPPDKKEGLDSITDLLLKK